MLWSVGETIQPASAVRAWLSIGEVNHVSESWGSEEPEERVDSRNWARKRVGACRMRRTADRADRSWGMDAASVEALEGLWKEGSMKRARQKQNQSSPARMKELDTGGPGRVQFLH